MSYELFIAERYFRSKRKTGFISLITIFSLGGILIGVAALIITLAIMNGFETEVRTRIIGFDAHIRLNQIHKQPGFENYPEIIDQLKHFDHVVGCAPYIIENAIIQTEKPKTIIVKGVDAEAERDVSKINEYLVAGNLDFGMVPFEGEPPRPGILLGRGVADRLVVGLMDKVYLISPAGLSLTGGPFQTPMVRIFRVTGVFESGLNEFDSNIGLIGINQAQDFFQYGTKIQGIEIKLDHIENSDAVAADIRNKFGEPYTTETWFERNKTLFSWMQIEKWVAFIVLSLIILVAAFNIISTLIMIVMEKNKEVGILKTMGATFESIMRIFLFHGLVVGLVGTVLGSLIGYVACWTQMKYEWFSLPSDIYFIHTLPIEMKVTDFIFISLSALMLTIVASIYPAWKASKLEPVEAIRYE